MMSLAIMENAIDNGGPDLLRSLGRGQAEAVVADFRSLVPEVRADKLAFLLRFGYAPPPTCRTGRLPLEARATSIGRMPAVEADPLQV